MTRFLYTIGGELRPLRPGSPCRISGVFRSTMPLSPNAAFGSPVFASSEYSLPSLDPKTICAGVCASPGQYSTPRVDGFPTAAETPIFLARSSIERDDAAVRRRDVHHAVDDERRRLARARTQSRRVRGRAGAGSRGRSRRQPGAGRM